MREIASGGEGETGREGLQDDRHQARQDGDVEQRRAELRPAGMRRGPVARIHVAGGDEIARAGEGEKAAEERAAARHRELPWLAPRLPGAFAGELDAAACSGQHFKSVAQARG